MSTSVLKIFLKNSFNKMRIFLEYLENGLKSRKMYA